jgi:hypothetical protein
MIYVFTSAALNYLGKVRTLLTSVGEFLPEATFYLALAERRAEGYHVPELPTEQIIYASDLPIGGDPQRLFGHSIVELSTAMKAEVALRLLRRRDCDLVLYFDPDIVLFSPLEDLVETARRSSIALTPHLLEPEIEPKAIVDNEICALRHGAFNLGFLGLRPTPEGLRFSEWWADRTARFCRVDTASGLFTDQKWIDLAPGFFEELAILRNPRFNVAPWNISRRCVTGDFDVGFRVDGKPLGFYHFTGFDSGAHEMVVGAYAPDNQALRMLVQWYVRRTAELSVSSPPSWSYGTYADGTPIESAHRLVYRERTDLQAAFPDPYSTEDGGVLRWMQTSGPVQYPKLLW